MQAALQLLLQAVQRSEHMGCLMALISASNASLYKAASEGLSHALKGGAPP